MKPRILIVYTGGTIGMIEDQATKALRPFDFSHLMENVPKVKMLDYVIDNIQFDPPIDSSDMSPAHWQSIVRAVADNYDAYDGFVVLHGTDTMAYTASALSFMLDGLEKPVIITGSQLPIGEVRTDGEENLITALQIAAERDTDGRPMVQEVAILFEDFLWRGNRASKRSADNFNAFRSSNYPELAKIGLGIHYKRENLHRDHAHGSGMRVHYNLDTNVIAIDIFPGLTESSLRHMLHTPDVKGIVLRTYGTGNAPTAQWFTDAITDAVKRGIVIVNVTQCANGGVHPGRYLAGDILSSTGVVSGADITFEAALAKMMFLFGLGLDADAVRRRMAHTIAGEMSV
ncbi:MAG: asparaginase [Muribaculaceae bacterium]|nr:asparaginase [Muribaculaceae bacterium]